jgi:phospholipase/lecithinase/hemolysin
MILPRLARLLFLVLVSMCVAGLARGQVALQAYQNVVVFGDSLSDTGNVANLTQAKYTIAGRIPGPAGNYTDGRFTDGTDTLPPARNFNGVWIEQLASTFSTKPPVKDSLDGGTNYAYGFAFTGSGTSPLTFGPSNSLSVTVNNMGLQVSTYLATTPVITSQTLFVLWGGANDLLNATTTAQITTAATQELALVQALINAGGTNFLVVNLPPLGLIPRLNGSPTLSVPATQAAAGFNQALAAGLAAIPAANAGKTLHIYPLDVYTLFNFAVGPPLVTGLANVTAMSQGNITVNPDTYLFWDDLHPTTYGHHLIALAASTLLNPVVTTTTLSSSNLAANLNSPVVLTATVSGGSGALAPTGAVTFMDGSTVIGSSAVTMASSSSSSATLTTSALAAGVHPVTAVFTGVNGFGNSTSSAIMQTVTAPLLTPSLSPTSLSIVHGSTGTSTVTLSPVGGYTGTVTLACGTLPSHVTCSFSTSSFTFTATTAAQTSTLTISTKDMATASRSIPLRTGAGVALAGLPCLGLLALFRRRNMRGLGLMCFALLFSGGLVALSGCGGSNNTASTGSYTIPVIVTAGTTTTTLNVALTVQ